MNSVAQLARPKMQSQFISGFQTADEIRTQLQRAEYNSRPFSRKVVKFFKKDDDYEMCRYLWQWLVNNIEYDKEPKDKQTAKEIERFIVDGYGDCKHYATTSVGILNACGIPAWFVLAGQEQGNKRPNHAYAEALVNGNVVVIDPCRRKKFNSECTHYYKWTYEPIKKNEIMALHYLSGDEAEIGKRKTKAERRKKHDENKSKRKEKRKTRKKKIAKIGLAPARAALLTLTTLNALNMAKKMARVYKKDKNELKTFWEKFGGDWGHLAKAIAKGAKQQISGDEIGIALEAALATAVPLLIALVPLIKKHGAEGDSDEAKAFDDGIDKGKKELATNDDFQKSSANMPEDSDMGLVRKGKGEGDGSGEHASFFSPLGLFFKTPLLLALAHPQNAFLAFLIAFVTTYCIVGLIVFPFYQWNWFNLAKYVTPFVELPKKLFYGTCKKIFS